MLRSRSYWKLPATALLAVALFCFAHVKAEAMMASYTVVFGGTVTEWIPSAICEDEYTCEACTQCGCGEWNELTIAEDSGTEPRSTFFMCLSDSYVNPFAQGEIMVGERVLGGCTSNYVETYEYEQCDPAPETIRNAPDTGTIF